MVNYITGKNVLTREGARLAGGMRDHGLDIFDIAVILDVDVDRVIDFVVI